MALRKIVSVVPPYLPQSLAPVPAQDIAFIPLNYIHDWSQRPNSWALLCLEPILHFHPIRAFGNSSSLSSLREAVSPHQNTSTVDLVSLGHRQGKIHPPIFTVGKRRHQREEKVILSTLHTCSSDSQIDRLSHPPWKAPD